VRIVELRIAGYRSIEDLVLPVRRLEVIVGPNGSGKSNLYRAVQLLSQAADGTLARALALEGGMPSVLWAGERRYRKAPVRIALEVRFDGLIYELELGLPTPSDSAFHLDPEVKLERLTADAGKRAVLMERKALTAWSRDMEGVRVTFPFSLWPSESVLSQISEPQRFPIAAALRQELVAWRFYHAFRTDPDAAARHPQVGVRTGALAHDGSDLAAAIQTIGEIGDATGLKEAIADAFSGARLDIDVQDGRFLVVMDMPGLKRPLRASELSDGTLRYLSLVAALLAPRPAPFIVLNEPEVSIHPDLLEPLARLIHRTSATTQILLTTHSTLFAKHLEHLSKVAPTRFTKRQGATMIGHDDERVVDIERRRRNPRNSGDDEDASANEDE
jgi:predicted ATPase